jgi:hypothetical protein
MAQGIGPEFKLYWKKKKVSLFIYLFHSVGLAKQALYHFSHSSSPSCSGYFGDGDS